MGEAIGAVLAFAVGVGLSPIPLIAIVLMLFTARARPNGLAFLLAWLAGLGAVFTVLYLLSDPLDLGTDDAATEGVAWLKVGLGVLLLMAAARKWHRRPAPGEPGTVPGWMAGLGGVGPARAAGIGLLLAVNPKNLLLGVGAATNLAALAATGGEAVAAGVAFVLVGSAGVIAAVVYERVGGAAARTRLDDAKGWLMANSATVLMVLYVVFGAVLISEGLALRS
jgi:Sap, sulfolipid-1-addressing protein